MNVAANWNLFPGYTVIGITLGGIYALAAIGLVLIYRVSGVLNFAQGAVSMFSAFVAYQVSTVMGAAAAIPPPPSSPPGRWAMSSSASRSARWPAAPH
jgi:branched-subunit amino acid ABC-type transport system permease component